MLKGLAPIGGGFFLPLGPAEGSTSETDAPEVPYVVKFVVELERGRYVCTSLECQRREDGPPVTGQGLRDLPVSRLTGLAFTYLAQQLRHESGLVDEDSDELLRVAAAYRFAYAVGLPPTKHVAAELGIADSTATKKVMRARRAGLLGPTTPGKAGEL